jgi:hypothetical protein
MPRLGSPGCLGLGLEDSVRSAVSAMLSPPGTPEDRARLGAGKPEGPAPPAPKRRERLSSSSSLWMPS